MLELRCRNSIINNSCLRGWGSMIIIVVATVVLVVAAVVAKVFIIIVKAVVVVQVEVVLVETKLWCYYYYGMQIIEQECSS